MYFLLAYLLTSTALDWVPASSRSSTSIAVTVDWLSGLSTTREVRASAALECASCAWAEVWVEVWAEVTGEYLLGAHAHNTHVSAGAHE